MPGQLGCGVLCVIVALAGQRAPAAPDAVSLDRIRAGLRTPTLTVPPPDGSLRYRVLVEGRRLRLAIPWDPRKDTIVAPYVHPRYAQPHFEFLRMVTPESHRAGTLYPMGPNVLPAAGGLVGAIRRTVRDRESAAIRRQIKEELRQLTGSTSPMP